MGLQFLYLASRFSLLSVYLLISNFIVMPLINFRDFLFGIISRCIFNLDFEYCFLLLFKLNKKLNYYFMFYFIFSSVGIWNWLKPFVEKQQHQVYCLGLSNNTNDCCFWTDICRSLISIGIDKDLFVDVKNVHFLGFLKIKQDFWRHSKKECCC